MGIFLSVGPRRHARQLAKLLGEVALAVEAATLCDFSYADRVPRKQFAGFHNAEFENIPKGAHAELGLESLVKLAWRQVACRCQLRDRQRFGELVANQAQRVAQALLGAFRPVFSINNTCVSKLSDNLCVLEVAQRDLCRRRLEDLSKAVDNQLGLVVNLAAFQHGDVIGMNGGRQTLYFCMGVLIVPVQESTEFEEQFLEYRKKLFLSKGQADNGLIENELKSRSLRTISIETRREAIAPFLSWAASCGAVVGGGLHVDKRLY